MIIKIFISIFIFFAASRVYLRYREGAVGFLAMMFWWLLWGAVGFFTWWPNFSDIIANISGVGRGLDALIYISIIMLFYFIFRVYIKLEFIERELTSFVRKIAIKDLSLNKDKEKIKSNEDSNNQ